MLSLKQVWGRVERLNKLWDMRAVLLAWYKNIMSEYLTCPACRVAKKCQIKTHGSLHRTLLASVSLSVSFFVLCCVVLLSVLQSGISSFFLILLEKLFPRATILGSLFSISLFILLEVCASLRLCLAASLWLRELFSSVKVQLKSGFGSSREKGRQEGRFLQFAVGDRNRALVVWGSEE